MQKALFRVTPEEGFGLFYSPAYFSSTVAPASVRVF